MPREVHNIYVDGSVRYRRVGCGVFYGPRDRRNLSVSLSGLSPTEAEFEAVILALEDIVRENNYTRLYCVKTDSFAVFNTLDASYEKCEEDDKFDRWKGLRKAKQLYDQVVDSYRERGLVFNIVHVQGHSGIFRNEMADLLARIGSGCKVNQRLAPYV